MTNKIEYSKFCEKEKEIPIFAQPWHMDAVCGEMGWDILLVKKGNEIAASMPIQINKKYGFRMPRMPHLTKYWGPYFPKKFRSEKKQQKLMTALIEQLPKFDYFLQYFHPYLTNWLPFFWRKFDASVGYTFVIDLENDLEKIRSNFDTDYRNNKIPKAEGIVKITSEKSIDDLYNLQVDTFNRQNLTMPFSVDFLKKYDQALVKNNSRKIFFAMDEKDQIHAVVYLIWDEHTVYLQMAGHDTKLRSSGAGIFLIWHSIKFSKEVLRKKRFDFVGSMIEPITNVRRNFGAKQTPYFKVSKYQSKLLKFLHVLKS